MCKPEDNRNSCSQCVKIFLGNPYEIDMYKRISGSLFNRSISVYLKLPLYFIKKKGKVISQTLNCELDVRVVFGTIWDSLIH